MSDPKLGERFATPSSSKLAQILLDLRGVEGSVGICNLQQSDIQLWSETYRQDDNTASDEVELSSQQDTCNCRKSKCLKLYCQCFAARATCSSSCRCVSCENRPDNATTRDAAVNLILERNPNAFDSKYRPTAGSTVMSSTFTAVTSIAHKNGCRCRKSMCLKKYCECFQGGVPCSSICTCLSCQNTGPAVHLAAQTVPSAASVASASAAAAASQERASSVGSLASGSDALLLSSRSLVSDHSLFTTAANGNSGEHISLFKSIKGYPDKVSESNSPDTLEMGLNKSRPPLVPSHKRKRESGSEGSGEEEQGEEERACGDERRGHQQGARSGTGGGAEEEEASSRRAAAAASSLPLPLTPNMSRAQQQQLLRELLFQELQSQGILSSPLTSFLTTNCPGLMQSQGTTIDDINNLFKNGPYAGASTPATSGTLLSYTPGASSSTAPASNRVAAGISTASPNTFSIATALALLAANAQAQAIAAHQLQQQQQSAASVAICENRSPVTEVGLCRSSVPASALAMDSARWHQQQAAYVHDSIASLASSSKLGSNSVGGINHACTPVAAVQLLGAQSSSSQGGMTDEETLGTGGSGYSDDSLADRPEDCADLHLLGLGLPAKTLFGGDGLPSPDAVEAPRRVLLPLAKAAAMAEVVGRVGVEMDGEAREARDKENASPNNAHSLDRIGMYGSLWR